MKMSRNVTNCRDAKTQRRLAVGDSRGKCLLFNTYRARERIPELRAGRLASLRQAIAMLVESQSTARARVRS